MTLKSGMSWALERLFEHTDVAPHAQRARVEAIVTKASLGRASRFAHVMKREKPELATGDMGRLIADVRHG